MGYRPRGDLAARIVKIEAAIRELESWPIYSPRTISDNEPDPWKGMQ